MHQNPIFRRGSEARALAFAEERGFGAFSAPAAEPERPALIAHAPFVFREDGRLESHFMRSNPLARRAAQAGPEGLTVTLIVMGPDAYISPDWYGLDPADQVPTWNYVAVHISGRLRISEDAALRPHLDRLSAAFERRLAPKPEWRVDKMKPEAFARMARGIVPATLEPLQVESTWKANQNKPDGARAGAAGAIEALGAMAVGSAPATAMAGVMRSELEASQAAAPAPEEES